jgi:hypothetical protein
VQFFLVTYTIRDTLILKKQQQMSTSRKSRTIPIRFHPAQNKRLSDASDLYGVPKATFIRLGLMWAIAQTVSGSSQRKHQAKTMSHGSSATHGADRAPSQQGKFQAFL